MIHTKKIKKNNKAFTLVETLVAITIVTVTMVGPFYAVQSALTSAFIARDSLIASHLAQEAVEYVRSIRDNFYLSGSSSWWDNFKLGMGLCYTPSGCIVDPPQNLISGAGSPASPLFLSPSSLYTHAFSGTQTRFTRTVRLTNVSSNEVRIEVRVSYVTAQNQTYTVTVAHNIFNWL